MPIRLIDEKGKQLGVFDFPAAQNIAKEKGLDLVVVADKTSPQVYRLMDYGKKCYADRKKEKKSRKIKIKGVRISFRTGEHDLGVKLKQIDKFLKKGDKVKIEIFLKGREKAFRNEAKELLEKFLQRIEESFKLEQVIKESPRGFNTLISKNYA